MKKLLLFIFTTCALSVNAQDYPDDIKIVKAGTVSGIPKVYDLKTEEYVKCVDYANVNSIDSLKEIFEISLERQEHKQSTYDMILQYVTSNLPSESEIYNQVLNNKYINGPSITFEYTDKNGVKQPLIIPVDKNGNILYSAVIKMDNLSSKQIYSKAKMALSSFWKSTEDAIFLDDTINNIIISKGKTQWEKKSRTQFLTIGFYVWFSVKIECRDNRYRISIYDTKSSSNGLSSDFITSQSNALNRGLKDNGVIKNDINGLSWLAWRDVSVRNIEQLIDLINEADINTSDDW